MKPSKVPAALVTAVAVAVLFGFALVWSLRPGPAPSPRSADSSEEEGVVYPHEGFGRFTVGGDKGPTFPVSSLADSGIGSLRKALLGGEGRVVFEVGGEIVLQSPLKIRASYVTIDGLSAPAPGITLRGAGVIIAGDGGGVHDVILRGLRIRGPGSGDAISIRDGAFNVVVDHVSLGECSSRNLDIGPRVHDLTISWSVFSTCPDNVLVKGGSKRVTFHHNVFAKARWRNPWIAGGDAALDDDTTADVRNNLVWQWGEGGGTGVDCGATVNAVDNYYFSPASEAEKQARALVVKTCPQAAVYTAGNVSGDPIPLDLNARGQRAEPLPAPAVATSSACAAAHETLAGAGVRPFDAIDAEGVGAITLPACEATATP